MNVTYVCRESFGPYKKGEKYDSIPEEFKGTGVFVKVQGDTPSKSNAAPIQEKG